MIPTYLMARYSRHPEMQKVAAIINTIGYSVCSRWIWGEHEMHDAAIGTGTLGALEQHFAEDDVSDLKMADLCISFSDPMRTGMRGGKMVELGMALAWGKPIFVVGGNEHVFHALPQITHMADHEALYEALKHWRKTPRAEMANFRPGQ